MTNPRKFSFQLQFNNEAETCRDSLVAEVARIVKSCGGSVMGTSVGQENGGFFANINAEAQDAYAFWRAAKNNFTTSPPPKSTTMMIVVCEGDDGWNNYHLLYHFDKSQPIEELTQQA